jgi:hypothetical protein
MNQIKPILRDIIVCSSFTLLVMSVFIIIAIFNGGY